MNTAFGNLWHTNGSVDRRTYALVGLVGFALKHNLDRFVASYGFDRPWGIFNYWVPIRDVARITNLQSSEARFLETMVAISLPFVWIGVAMTLKRLRSAGLSPQLVALFFVPFVNLLFFLLLCLLPPRTISLPTVLLESEKRSPFLRIFPESALGSATAALLVTVPLGLGITLFGTQVLTNYGWGLFVALPFALGFTAALVYGIRQPRRLLGCVGVACLSSALLGAALFALAFEGVICLIMTAPIALPLSAFGGLCAYTIQKHRWIQSNAPAYLSMILVLVPGIQSVEHLASRQSPLIVVRTSIDIQASPEKVWREVVAFSEIPAPTEWFFRAGVAYPVRAEITGKGAGAERHCVFSTGSFVEPIQVWEEPRLLKFSVTSNPAPMQEWTPYTHVDPPHLHGFLVSEGGQFALTPLPSGATRLEGTTWYRHGLWPSAYWQLWSDAIIHRIHLRVLRHIRDVAQSSSALR